MKLWAVFLAFLGCLNISCFGINVVLTTADGGRFPIDTERVHLDLVDGAMGLRVGIETLAFRRAHQWRWPDSAITIADGFEVPIPEYDSVTIGRALELIGLASDKVDSRIKELSLHELFQVVDVLGYLAPVAQRPLVAHVSECYVSRMLATYGDQVPTRENFETTTEIAAAIRNRFNDAMMKHRPYIVPDDARAGTHLFSNREFGRLRTSVPVELRRGGEDGSSITVTLTVPKSLDQLLRAIRASSVGQVDMAPRTVTLQRLDAAFRETLAHDLTVPGNEFTGVWAPDGVRLAVYSTGGRDHFIGGSAYIIDTALGRLQCVLDIIDYALPHFYMHEFKWSPDGRHIAAFWSSPGGAGFYVWETETGRIVVRNNSFWRNVDWFDSETLLLSYLRPDNPFNVWPLGADRPLYVAGGDDGRHAHAYEVQPDRAILDVAQPDEFVTVWRVPPLLDDLELDEQALILKVMAGVSWQQAENLHAVYVNMCENARAFVDHLDKKFRLHGSTLASVLSMPETLWGAVKSFVRK